MSTSRLSAHGARVVTGLCLAAALVFCLGAGGIYLQVALLFVALAALAEFYQMFWPGRRHMIAKAVGLAACASVFHASVHGDHAMLCITVAGTFIIAALSFLFAWGGGDDEARLEHASILPLGLIYIPVILQFALDFSLREQVLVVAAAIFSDTAAYYVGCAIGRHRIWPRVSPKKSWEGSMGGFAASMLVTLIIGYVDKGGSMAAQNVWWQLLLLGAFLNVAAQLGDFFESALKRVCQVKDSSALLPGHGGILDRIDSLLFVILAYSFVRWLEGFDLVLPGGASFSLPWF